MEAPVEASSFGPPARPIPQISEKNQDVWICPECGAVMDWSGDLGGFDEDCRCLDFVVWYCYRCGGYFGEPL